jgi:hypothetical protein
MMRTKMLETWGVCCAAVYVVLALGVPAHAQARCRSDRECAADKYCAPTGACASRCDPQGLCVGPPVSTTLGIATDGTHVCFAGARTDPRTGASEVWSWDASAAPPRLLGRSTGLTALLIADGFCYYAGARLERARMSRGREQLVGAATPKRLWLGPEHVWWTVANAEGLEVWRMPRAVASAPELLAQASAEQNWEAASSTQLFRRVQGSRACDIVSAPIDDLESESVMRMTYSWACSGELQTDEQGLFFNQYSGNSYQLHRLDFANPALQINTGLSSSDYGPVRYVLSGAWLFAARVGNPAPGGLYPVTFYRKPKRLDAPPSEQLHVAPAGTPNTRAMQFAVLGDTLVFVTREGRLAAQTIAPSPCSPELPCLEEAGSCGADLICQ